MTVSLGGGAWRRLRGGSKTMTRILKALTLAALAVASLAVFSTTASASRFTSPGAGGGTTTIVTEKDAANPAVGQTGGQTAHQVFDIRKSNGTGVLSITCNEAFGTNGDVVGEESSQISTTLDFRGDAVSPNCSFAGQLVSVSSGSCEFRFSAFGTLSIWEEIDAEGQCRHGSNPIVFENSVLKCKVEIGSQSISGVTYHNIEVAGKAAVTTEANNLTVTYNATGIGCPYGTTSNGLYTTGNIIFRGERGGSFVPFSWDA